jgi:glucose/arabinose dehydrogenase
MKQAICASLFVLASSASQSIAQSVETLWERNCASCHGKLAQGGGAGTKSFLTEEYRSRSYDRGFFDTIKEGKADLGMSAFGETLTNEQIWGLVNHIRQLQDEAFRKGGGGPKRGKEGVYTSQHATYKVSDVVDDLSTPWSVDFLPDGGMLITERPGTLRLWKDGTLSAPIKNTPRSRETGQGGLMDVAIHPDYAKNGLIFLAFTQEIDDHPGKQENHKGTHTALVRGTIKDGVWTTDKTIWQAKPEHYIRSGLHFGCRIVWGERVDGKYELFFALGERGNGANAQNLGNPNGKIHRVWDDGSVPSDNPFAQQSDAYASIWSNGHRNPQGLVRDLEGNLWDTEHGPRGGDELNIINKGHNYGWPIVSYGIEYNGTPTRVPWADVAGDKAKGVTITNPVDVWLPSVGVCGLDVATGGVFDAWKGDLFAGGLAGESVDRFRLAKNDKGEWVVREREEVLRGAGRVRDVRTGPDGSIYVVLNNPDKVVRIVPAGK